MRKRVFLWMSALFLFVSASLAQDIPAGLSIAFKKGNSQELSNYLGSKVNLIIQNRSSDVNNQTAQTMMADFFSKNKVIGFSVNHQGRRDESGFVIGTLTTDNGSFRVNCFFKRVDNRFLIYQIRIDKTNE